MECRARVLALGSAVHHPDGDSGYKRSPATAACSRSQVSHASKCGLARQVVRAEQDITFVWIGLEYKFVTQNAVAFFIAQYNTIFCEYEHAAPVVHYTYGLLQWMGRATYAPAQHSFECET